MVDDRSAQAPQLDCFVLGAGPAGMAAATEAASLGLRTAIADMGEAPGGQVYRSPSPALKPHRQAVGNDPDWIEGERMRMALSESGAAIRLKTRVWSMARRAEGGFRLSMHHDQEGLSQVTTTALVLANGCHEKLVPVAGWTKPGVMGLAAATIALKAGSLLPGDRTVVAGGGPLLWAVAAGIVKGGGKVAALVDHSGFGDWLAALPVMATQSDLLIRGLAWHGTLLRAGVPIFRRHRLSKVLGGERVEGVEIEGLDSKGFPTGAHRTLTGDALAMGQGLVPSLSPARLLGAECRFSPEDDLWIPVSDGHTRTNQSGLYVAGDLGGVRGARAAALEGRLAALTVAFDQGKLSKSQFELMAEPLRRAHHRAAKFGAAMARLMRPPPPLWGAIDQDTIVCRCEGLRRREIDQAGSAGAGDMNQLKSWTRCGMGPCQGRLCGEAASALLSKVRGVGREALGSWTAREPLMPLPLADLVGEFDYAEIPQPPPAPA